MARLRKYRRATMLSFILAAAHAASIPSVFQQQATCAAEGFSPCGNGLPTSFCCATGSTCISLAGNSTVLCCPEGSNCDRVIPITCNVSLQDPDTHPDAVIKTTALKSKLPTCGPMCCPFGYTCNDAQQCVVNSDQSEKPSELPASELPTVTPGPTSSVAVPTVIPTTITSTSSPEAPSAPAQQDGDDGAQENNESTFPTAIVIGVLCGVLAGVGLGIALLLFLSRRRRRNNNKIIQNEKKRSGLPRPSTSTSSFGNIISEPIPMSDSALRTDFILKTPSTVHSRGSPGLSPTRTGGSSRISSTATTLAHQPIGIARSDSKPRTPDRSTPQRGIPVPPIRGMRPGSGSHRPPNAYNPLLTTPAPLQSQRWQQQQNMPREPSSESINVFADPRTVGRPGHKRLTSATTFTDLMEEADLVGVGRGEPFVPRTPQMPPPATKR